MAEKKKEKKPQRKVKKAATPEVQKNTTLSETKSKKQVAAIVTFAVGVFLFLLSIIPIDGGWGAMRSILFGLFGWCGFLVAPILIFISIISAMDASKMIVRHRTLQGIVLVVLLCGISQAVASTSPNGQVLGENGFFQTIRLLFENGVHYKGGGVCSALVGWPLIAFFTPWGAVIALAIVIFVFLLLITGTTLMDFLKTAAIPAKKVGEKTHEAVERRKQAKFDVDVPLDTEIDVHTLPMHPVTSNKVKLTQAAKELDEVAGETKKEAEKADTKAVIKEVNAENAQPQKQEKPPQIDDIISKLMEKKGVAPTASTPPSAPKSANRVVTSSDVPTVTAFDDEKEGVKKMTKDEVEEQTGAFVQEVIQGVDNKILYQFPPVSLLKIPENPSEEGIEQELKTNASRLVQTLQSFGVQTRITDICRGPAVTRYELQPQAGVKISRITGLSDDIALNLASAGVRIEAPIPNKAAVGIEVPNKNVSVVGIRDIIDSNKFVDSKSKLSFAIGKNIDGQIAIGDIGKMPHVLIAGATGSGKSVCINSIIISLIYKSSPEDVRLLMIDPKVVELGVYNGIPHLLVPVVTDPRKAAGALNWAVTEMLNRYKLFADSGVRDLKGYNELANSKDDMKPLPQIVIIIDELADLMMAAPREVEDAICRLAQMARAAGMHLVIATQRPSVDVITGVIKANIPSRIAFAVSSQVDSRTILDSGGAEKLLGRGDMLYYPVGIPKPIRIQGCFVSDKEVESVVEFIKSGKVVEYDEKIIEEIDRRAAAEKTSGRDSESGDSTSDEDPMITDAIECVIEAGQASTSLLQRRLKLGYARAARIIDQMEQRGIVGPFEGAKPREVRITRQQWQEMTMRSDSYDVQVPEAEVEEIPPFEEEPETFEEN